MTLLGLVLPFSVLVFYPTSTRIFYSLTCKLSILPAIFSTYSSLTRRQIGLEIFQMKRISEMESRILRVSANSPISSSSCSCALFLLRRGGFVGPRTIFCWLVSIGTATIDICYFMLQKTPPGGDDGRHLRAWPSWEIKVIILDIAHTEDAIIGLAIQLLLMGNILATASEHHAVLISSLTALSVFLYMAWEAKERKQFKSALLEAMKSEGGEKAEKVNQVYLKDQVRHYNIRNKAQNPIYKIAVTGGPCAGKSTSMEKVKNIFSAKGYRVLCVPEVPTMVVVAGGMILMSQFNSEERVRFQALLIRFQMYAEDYFTKLAEMANQPAIVLCDRGTVDPAAYIPKEEFQAVLDEEGWTMVTLRDRRYDRVCFLNSAANGAEDFYTLANNVARSEGIELARDLDRKTLDAWTGHPHLSIVPNVKGETFDDKVNRVVEAVAKTVGEQLHNVIYNKFLIKKPDFPEGLKFEVSTIEETFLANENPEYEEDKLKKRGSANSFTYQRKFKCVKNDANFSQEIRKPLTPLQYMTLKEQKEDKNFKTVTRERINFTHNSNSYSIDVYHNFGEDLVYLLRFSTKKGEEMQLVPPFIEFIKDVKDDKQYKLREIARK